MRVRTVLGVLLTAAVLGGLVGGVARAVPTVRGAVASAVDGVSPHLAAGAPRDMDLPADAPAADEPVLALGPEGRSVTRAVRLPVQVPGTPCLDNAAACISLSGNQAWLLGDGGVAYGPVPITHGRPGWTTPPGTFQVTYLDRDHRSSLFDDAPMPYSVFFNGGIAFHEGSLSVLSHGCIHLSRAAAQEFFGALDTGDVVQVVR